MMKSYSYLVRKTINIPERTAREFFQVHFSFSPVYERQNSIKYRDLKMFSYQNDYKVYELVQITGINHCLGKECIVFLMIKSLSYTMYIKDVVGHVKILAYVTQ